MPAAIFLARRKNVLPDGKARREPPRCQCHYRQPYSYGEPQGSAFLYNVPLSSPIVDHKPIPGDAIKRERSMASRLVTWVIVGATLKVASRLNHQRSAGARVRAFCIPTIHNHPAEPILLVLLTFDSRGNSEGNPGRHSSGRLFMVASNRWRACYAQLSVGRCVQRL